MAEDWLQVYRASLYAFPAERGGGERAFALDGPEAEAAEGAARLGLERGITLITAWNPQSEERERAWNEAANLRLAAALEEAGVPHAAAWGGSLPDTVPAWREEGFVLYGLSRAEAARWGREWQQRALVQVDDEAAGLLFSDEEDFRPCGVRLLDRAGG